MRKNIDSNKEQKNIKNKSQDQVDIEKSIKSFRDDLVRIFEEFRIGSDNFPKDEMEKILKELDEKKIPSTYNNVIGNGLNTNCKVMIYRDKVIKRQGFSLVSESWIAPLSKYLQGKKCLEIMAGFGTISKALQDLDIDIIATDNFSWNGWDARRYLWTDVEEIDCIEAIEKYGQDIDYILCSWPYMDDTAYRALMKMRDINPKCKMIYIGEWISGCTANYDFFSALEKVEDEEIDMINCFYSRWPGIHDRIYLIR